MSKRNPISESLHKFQNRRGSAIAVLPLLFFILGFAVSQAYNGMDSDQLGHLQPSSYYKGLVKAGDITNPVREDNGVIIDSKDGNSLYLIKNITPTGSMRPTISDDSIVIMAPVSKEKIKVGDIIQVKREGQIPLLHRVIEIKEGKYTTKGDNNENKDTQSWEYKEIFGKVVGVLY